MINSFAITDGFLVFSVVVLIVYDLFALYCWGVEATISRSIAINSKRYPIIPFAIGVVAGHWFW